MSADYSEWAPCRYQWIRNVFYRNSDCGQNKLYNGTAMNILQGEFVLPHSGRSINRKDKNLFININTI